MSKASIDLAKRMIAADAKPAKVALELSKEYKQFIIAKDIHNLKSNKEKELNDKDSIKLKKEIQQQIKRDGNKNYFHFIQSKEELYGVFYQTNKMRNLIQTFGEILFVDGTYKLNKHNYPVILFIVTDQNRHSRIVGVAIIAFERQLVLKCILDFFKSLNETKVIKYIMIDKDLKEDNVLSEAIPHATLLYCFWHVEKIFIRRYKSKAIQQLCKEMMLAPSEQVFDEKKNELFSSFQNNQKELEYFNSNWLNCIEKCMEKLIIHVKV